MYQRTFVYIRIRYDVYSNTKFILAIKIKVDIKFTAHDAFLFIHVTNFFKLQTFYYTIWHNPCVTRWIQKITYNTKNTMMDMTNRQSNTIYKYCLSLLINNDIFSKLEHYKVIKVLSFFLIWIFSTINKYMFFPYIYNIMKWTFKNIMILGSNIIVT